MLPSGISNNAKDFTPISIATSSAENKAADGVGARLSSVANSGENSPCENDETTLVEPPETGTEVSMTRLIKTVKSLTRYAENANSLILGELIQKCNDPAHCMFGISGQLAEQHGLIEHGQMQELTRTIILSSVKNNGFRWKFENPLPFDPKE